jgi:hypothetical protein
MYLSDIIEPLITEKLREICVGKQVFFYDENANETLIECKDVYFESDDGYCWVCFIDKNGEKYISNDQEGIDIYFEIKDE